MYRRRRLAVAVLALLSVGVLVLGFRGVQALISPGGSAAGDQTPVTGEAPVRLGIPAVGLSLSIRGEGLDDDGQIRPPQGGATWYVGHDRVTPGQLGTAVVAGHASYRGEPDTFADLASVQEGDQVTLTAGDGGTLDLDVVSTHYVSDAELPGFDLVWDGQQTERRVALVTADEVELPEGGAGRAHFVAIAEAG